MLYQMEMTRLSPEETIASYNEMTLDDESEEPKIPEAARPFTEHLVNGVHSRRGELDDMIASASSNWRVDRMSIIDRNVLRIALFEMLHCREIPPKVSINEAIDLGKMFGSPDSGSFINGVLDRLLEQVNRIREQKAPTP